MRRPARFAAVVATAGVALLGAAAPALAHAEVTRTSPEAGSTVHGGNLSRISVTFDEAVTLVPHALHAATSKGLPVSVGAARLSKGGTVLSAPLKGRLAAGRYFVAWRVQSDDGHLESSTFSFIVDAAAATKNDAAAAGLPPVSPAEPLWPVLVAAAVAVIGGLAAGIAVRRGLRLVRRLPIAVTEHTVSPSEHETLRVPM